MNYKDKIKQKITHNKFCVFKPIIKDINNSNKFKTILSRKRCRNCFRFFSKFVTYDGYDDNDYKFKHLNHLFCRNGKKVKNCSNLRYRNPYSKSNIDFKRYIYYPNRGYFSVIKAQCSCGYFIIYLEK